MGSFDFADWLQTEMLQRGLKQADLAREAKINQPTLSRILTRERKPGPEVCTALAKALDIPPDVVFLRAGLLPEVSRIAVDSITQEAAVLMQQLDQSDREEVLNFIKFRLRQAAAKGK
jgi:transcriptional regulator with XRE-family HTH domain